MQRASIYRARSITFPSDPTLGIAFLCKIPSDGTEV